MIAIYSRQSVDKKDSISIDTQIETCKRLCDPNEEVVVYSDKGYSGSNTNRPEFKRMIQDIKDGSITQIIVYRLDRISRSVCDFENLYKFLHEHNVTFKSCAESFDTSTPTGEAMVRMVMVFAELERRTIQMRIVDNYAARAERGMYLGGPAPFGFDKVPVTLDNIHTSSLVPNENADIVRQMYEKYSDPSVSLSEIARWLTDSGIESPKKVGWESGRISLILKNPVYVRADVEIYQYYKRKGCAITNPVEDFTGTNGCWLYGRRKSNERKYTDLHEHKLSLALHEGIVDSDLFLLCQQKMAYNRPLGNSGKPGFTWLTGLVKCGHCGYALRFVKMHGGDDRYASCSGSTNKHICNGLGDSTVYMHSLEKIVAEQLIKHMEEIRDNMLINGQSAMKTSDSMLQERNTLNQKVLGLIEQMSVPGLSSSARSLLSQQLNDYSLQLERIEKEIYNASIKIGMEEIYHMYDVIQKWDEITIEQKKLIAGFFIEIIKVTSDDVDITFRHKLT